MSNLFTVRNFIFLLLCLQKVFVGSTQHELAKSQNEKHVLEEFKLSKDHLRSFIETKRVIMDIPILKIESENIENENENTLETETKLDNRESSDHSLDDFLAKMNETFESFKNRLEEVVKKQNSLETSLQIIADSSKSSSKALVVIENLRYTLEEVTKKQNSLENSLQSFEESCKTNAKKVLSSDHSSKDHWRIHDEYLNCLQNCTPVESEFGSCLQTNLDGAYVFKISNRDLQPFYSYCRRYDDDKIWTVIQRREDGSINFNRGWNDYKHGFGDVYGEYWIGLERLHALTNSQDYELKVFLEDFEGTQKEAKYSKFSIASEDQGYMLTLGTYSGNAGDSFTKHNSLKFTTYDVNNNSKKRNCAQKYKGGWWYHSCYNCNLNGQYCLISDKETVGVKWNGWKDESLRRVIMAIRPL